MSKNNNRIPFKPTNKLPINFSEIDINLLMQNPKHIRKLMGKGCDKCDGDCGCDSSPEKVLKDDSVSIIDKFMNKKNELGKKVKDKYTKEKSKVIDYMNDDDSLFRKYDRKLLGPAKFMRKIIPDFGVEAEEYYRLKDLEKKTNDKIKFTNC